MPVHFRWNERPLSDRNRCPFSSEYESKSTSFKDAQDLLIQKKKEVMETVIPEISDVQGLNTVSTELDNTNPDDLNTELNQLNQYYSAF